MHLEYVHASTDFYINLIYTLYRNVAEAGPTNSLCVQQLSCSTKQLKENLRLLVKSYDYYVYYYYVWLNVDYI